MAKGGVYMPYKKNPSKPFESMERLLNSYKINAPALSKIMGVSVPTARRKLNNPQEFLLSDIAKISKLGHVPIGKIREAIVEDLYGEEG